MYKISISIQFKVDARVGVGQKKDGSMAWSYPNTGKPYSSMFGHYLPPKT